ncbi:MAG: hypothetical protein AB1442_01210 [Nitrospirota bacterium]
MKKLILLLLLFAGFASAQNASIEFNVTSSECPVSGGLLETVSNLPACISEAFFSTITSGLVYASQQFLSYSFDFMLSVPDIHWFCGPYNVIMALLETLYTLAIMGLGLYYIARSTDVEGRVKAKRWLTQIFLMVVALAFSFYIFELMLDLNQQIAAALLAEAELNFFSVSASFSSIIFALVILIAVVTSAFLTFSTLLIRYILLPFLLLAFPFSIFLYFLPPTQNWGRMMLKVTAVIVFMTSFDALILLGLSALFHTTDPNLADTFIRSMAVLFGFAAIGFLNLALFLFAAISAILEGLRTTGEIIGQVARIAILTSLL